MAKILQCPHFISFGGTTRGCSLGHFPVNCESCDCPNKYYVEVFTSACTSEWPNYLKNEKQ